MWPNCARGLGRKRNPARCRTRHQVQGRGTRDEAVAIANDIAYGLGAGVWTQSVKRAHTMAARIKAGTVWVNTYRALSFLMPFGGYKASGLGRENGAEAIDGYLQSKSVWINNGGGGGNPFIMKTAS
jgi:(Z)-2-((N-methylformamido)methylene)-5-hydroxybutyrolactone dehydrogenase